MSEPQEPGNSPPPSDDREAGGRVLFDPTSRPEYEELWAQSPPERRAARFFIGLAVLVALAGGGYQLVRSGALSTGEPDAPPVLPPPVGAVGGPITLDLLGRAVLEGPAGSSVPLEVRARGAGSRAVADSLVRFRVASGGGILDPDTARTDQAGIARTTLTLPRATGAVVVLAGLDDSDQEGTRLVVNVRAGPPARITMHEGNAQETEVGEMLRARLSVIVYDEAGVPVPDASVRFTVLSGGGVAAPGRALTDSAGVASVVWRLGFEAGSQQLAAAAPDLDGSVVFTANAVARPVASDGNPLPAEAGPVTVEPRGFVIGGSHVCSLAGTTAQCRGANDRGQRGTNATGRFVALASGISHTCGLSLNGEASCWGANEGGQLGDGSRTDRPSPVPVRAEIRFASLTAGVAHTCGIAGRGIPVCWGQNLSGQLGDASRTDARFPRAVGGGVTFRTIVAGWNHTCGLTSNGNAFCWGLNSDGQLGDGSRLDRLVPVLVRGAIESLAAGSAHTCGVSERQVHCWGDNRAGQLGDGTNTPRVQPTRVPGLTAVTHVVAGAVHTCALVADGRAFCWGLNVHGQLGDGTTTNRNEPVAVQGDVRFRSIHAGGSMTCGFATDGTEYCWGLNQSGELGDGSRQSRSTPTRVIG